MRPEAELLAVQIAVFRARSLGAADGALIEALQRAEEALRRYAAGQPTLP